jgi:dCMP deaminase
MSAHQEWLRAHEQAPTDLSVTNPRISRDRMMMKIAHAVAERSTCSRLHVGAVIARDSRAVSTGYNGNPAGMPHCQHVGDDPCKNAVHAEANAIAFAARHGAPTEGAEMFTTHQPCLKCAQLIVNSGIVRVVYDFPYRVLDGLDLLNVLGIPCKQVDGREPE